MNRQSYVLNKEAAKSTQKDKGWAWVIMIGSLMVSFLEQGMYKTFGIFFVAYVHKFGASASIVSFVGGIFSAVYSISAIFIMTVGLNYFSCRQSVMIGGFLFFIGYLLSSFATNIYYLLFSQGVLTGMASAFLVGPCLLILGKYFDKYRGFANGMAFGFGSLGGLAIPPIVSVLLETFDLSGAQLIMSACLLNVAVGGALLRPFNDVNMPNDVTNRELELNQKVRYELDTIKDINSIRLENQEIDNIFTSQHKTHVYKQKNNQNLNKNIKTEQDAEERHRKSLCKPFPFETSLLKSPLFMLFLFSFCFGGVGTAMGHSFIPPYADEIGLNSKQISLLTIAIGSSDFGGRVLCALIIDCKCLQRYRIIMFGLFVLGITMQFSGMCTELYSLILFSTSFGASSGIMITFYGAVLVDFIGSDKLKNGLGIMTSMQGITVAVAVPFVGYLRDCTGTFTTSFYFMGACVLFGALLLCFVPLVRGLSESEEKEKNNHVNVMRRTSFFMK